MSVPNPIQDNNSNQTVVPATSETEALTSTAAHVSIVESGAAITTASKTAEDVVNEYYSKHPMGQSSAAQAIAARLAHPHRRPKSSAKHSGLPKTVGSHTDLSVFVKAKVLPPSPLTYDGYGYHDGGRKVKTEKEVIDVIRRNWEGYLANIFHTGMMNQRLKPNGGYPSINAEFDAGQAAKETFRRINGKYVCVPTAKRQINNPYKPPSKNRPSPTPKNGPWTPSYTAQLNDESTATAAAVNASHAATSSLTSSSTAIVTANAEATNSSAAEPNKTVVTLNQ